MNNRLLHYLKNHDASDRIMELKLDSKMIHAEDENKQTALQIAAQYGRVNIVLLLLSEGAEIKYINENMGYQHPLVAQILAACCEKKSDQDVVAGIYFYVLNHNAHELSERMAKHLPPAENAKTKLTFRQSKSYEFAEKKSENMMSHGCDNNIENYAALFAHAYTVKNYIALRTIVSGCYKRQIELLEYFLTTGQNDCARFLIVATAMDLYEIALHLHKTNLPLLEKLIHLAWSKEGLLQGLIEQSILEDKLPATDILLLIKTLQQQVSKDTMNFLFEDAVSERYQFLFTIKTANVLSEEKNKLVYSLGCRLNLSILRHGKDELEVFINCLPTDLHDIILNYCDINSKKELSGSTFFKTRMDLLNKTAESKKAAEIFHLNRQLRILNEFITTIQQELDGKTRWSHREQVYGTKEKLISLFALMVIAAFSSAMEPTVTRCIRDGVSEDFCDTSIRFYVSIPILFAVLALIRTGICPIICHQPQRFNDLPLTSYNAHTRAAAENMLNEFKGTSRVNPFEGCGLESKAGDMLTIARDERDTGQAKLASLMQIKEEHKIDINEDDFDEVPMLDKISLERKR